MRRALSPVFRPLWGPGQLSSGQEREKPEPHWWPWHETEVQAGACLPDAQEGNS